MAATIIIKRWTGTRSGSGTSAVGGTSNDITGINTVANATDTHQTTAASSSNPIRIPASGSGSTNYSFWVCTRLHCTGAPSGTVDNLKWYTDGSNNFGTGVTCNVVTANSYRQATGDAGTSGDLLNDTNYESNIVTASADAFNYTSGSPLTVAGSATDTDTNGFSDWVVYQLNVVSTAAAGATAVSETFTWSYDET